MYKPATRAGLKADIEEKRREYGAALLSVKDAGEEVVIRDGWLVIARSITGEIEKREAAVRFILQGKTGLAVPDAAGLVPHSRKPFVQAQVRLLRFYPLKHPEKRALARYPVRQFQKLF
jgi:hypothetical protein